MNWCVEWFELFVQLVKFTWWLVRGTFYYLKKLIDWFIGYLFFLGRLDWASLYEFFKDLPGFLLRVAAFLVFFHRPVDPLYNFGFLYGLFMKATIVFLIFLKVSTEKGNLYPGPAVFKLVVFCIFFYYNEYFFLDEGLFGEAMVIFLIFSKVSNEKGDLHKWLATFKLVVFCIFFYYNEDFFLDDSLFGVLALIVLLHFTLS